jgi:hypothetical protein
VDNPYRVVEKNAAETVALVEGEPGDALPIATVTLGNLQAFVDRLAGIAKPEDEIDLYLDFYVILGKPASGDGKRMALIQGMIVEEVPDDPAGGPGNESGTGIYDDRQTSG